MSTIVEYCVESESMLERRSAPRIEIKVELEGKRNGDVFIGTSVNLSEGGILIETNKVLTLGETITVRLVSQDNEEIVGKGEVVRYEDYDFGKLGYAVRWDLSPGQ